MKKIKLNFADFWHGAQGDDLQDNPFYKLLSKRYEIEISEEPDFLIYSCFGAQFLKYTCPRIFYTGENVRPNFGECDYAFSFDYLKTDRNCRLPIYFWVFQEFAHLLEPRETDEKSKFCNFVYSNANAPERVTFFEQLSKYKRIDSAGRALNNVGYTIPKGLTSTGEREKLHEFMSEYKFTIAFENSSYPGYTTEKILNAFLSNTVPIYWGNPMVTREFNSEAFINCHDYRTFEEVVARVIELDNNDDLYFQCLNQPCFADDRQPEFLDENRVIDKFDAIFHDANICPVATTWRQPYAQARHKMAGIARTAKLEPLLTKMRRAR